MADQATTIVQKEGYVQITVTGVDAEEDTPVVDLLELMGRLPTTASNDTTRTGGADDTVESNLQMSTDGSTWATVAQVTDVTGGKTATVNATAFPTVPYRYAKFNVADVGESGVLTLKSTFSAK